MSDRVLVEPLTITVRILTQELFDGRIVLAPVANLDLSSIGTLSAALDEQRAFLESYLSKVDAETIARYSMPGRVERLEVETLIPRDDLPRALQIHAPIEIDVILLPNDQDDAWVIVPQLRHTFYVSRKEDKQEAIAAEIRRVASVELTAPHLYRRLFPAKETTIETIEVQVDRDERLPGGRTASLKKRLIEKKQRHDAHKILESVAIPLHDRAAAHEGPPIVGRNRFLASLAPLLTGKIRLNVLLLGDELVGKTAVLYEWLRGEHEAGRSPLVYGTSGAQLIAGMSGLGQWQERVRRVMDAAERLDAILFFDDLRDLFGERATSTIDIPGAMKPILEEGRVRVIGELTPSAFTAIESRAASFFACFTRMRIEPLDGALTRRALEERVTYHRHMQPERPTLDRDAVDTVMDLTDRYLPYQPNPGKVMGQYEELRAIYERDVDERGTPNPITPVRVLEAFSRQTGIPSFLLREDRALERQEVIKQFQRRIIGQNEAVERVVDTICVVKAGLQPTGKPLATFLFVGPTGVGKTELARTLADFLFQDAERMVRFDMSEYADPMAAERLIRGTDRAEGLLTRKIRQQPFSVLLLDEIEKAHPAVLDLLLQVCGEGRLTDARGKTSYFHNAIIIMTSNLGAAHRRTTIGIDAPSTTTEAHYLREVRRAFRPELVNRLDRIIAFEALTKGEVLDVARVALRRIGERRGLLELGADLLITDEALDDLAEAGYSETYGARAIRRVLEDQLVAPAAHILSRAGDEARQARIVVSRIGRAAKTIDPALAKRKPLLKTTRGGLVFRLYGGRSNLVQKDAIDADAVGALRRRAKKYMALDAVEEAREQILYLRAELSQGERGKKDQRTAQERAALMRDHHRYTEAWDAVERCTGDLVTAEELTIGALFSGADPTDAVAEAEHAFAELQQRLVYLLLAREHFRDAAVLTLTEVDDGRALDAWLLPALDAWQTHGWTPEIHFAGEKPTKADRWYPLAPWGPPRHPDEIRARLQADHRRPLNLLLRINGPYAGVLLALEAGRHIYKQLGAGRPEAQLVIRFLGMRTQLDAKDYAREAMLPPTPDHTLRTGTPVVRTYDNNHQRLLVWRQERARPLPLDQYWPQIERITLEHLLGCELDEDMDREQLFVGPLDREMGLVVSP